MNTTAIPAALAAHRFGLGEASLDAVKGDAPGWLLAQIGPADVQLAPRDDALASSNAGLRRHAEFQRLVRQRRDGAAMVGAGSTEPSFAEHFRPLVQADVRARLGTAAATARPFAERLALFWSNHFTVSMAKAGVRGLVGAFEREAIRPHIAGRFDDLLRAAVTHPAMLRYLDNDQSAGPHSIVVQRRAARAVGDDRPRPTGLNENLAREVLELHTLGAAAARDGIYTQADVTAFAAVLTGWRVPARAYLDDGLAANDEVATRFEPVWHEPGTKTVLGRSVAEGADGLAQVLRHLATHPATARFVATKLARHFVADVPPAALVQRLERAFIASGGELPAVYRALVESPESWTGDAAKLKSPEEMVLSSARLLRLGARAFERNPDGGISLLGQRVQAAPSPAGWPDAADEWLGPDAVWKRVEWATRMGERLGAGVDARALAASSLGPLLSPASARQIERAADGAQALALLLLAPEFQRR